MDCSAIEGGGGGGEEEEEEEEEEEGGGEEEEEEGGGEEEEEGGGEEEEGGGEDYLVDFLVSGMYFTERDSQCGMITLLHAVDQKVSSTVRFP